jgi:hypothetical protein
MRSIMSTGLAIGMAILIGLGETPLMMAGAAVLPVAPRAGMSGATDQDALVQTVSKNVWPAPSARVNLEGDLVCINVSGLRA